jgi:hypothetical protein
MSGDTAERKMLRAVIWIVVGIMVCAALSVLGFLRLFGVI